MAREIKDFNRLELKYVVPHDRVDDLVRALGDYVVRDPNAREPGGYPLYSVYADSPELTFFWEKIEGLKYRRKVRFRRYGDSPDVWLEIKQRIDRTLQKRRTKWPLETVERVFFAEGGLDESAIPDPEDPVVQEILVLWRHHDLRPTMGTSYRRLAYFAANESDLRLTFDSRVTYHPKALGLREKAQPEKAIVDPDRSILEIKYNHTVPLWLCRLVARFELQMIRMSKYCTAVDKEYYGGELT